MSDKIKVIISDDQKAVKVPTGIRLLIRRCCNAVLVNEHFEGSVEVSVRFVDDEEIHRLNIVISLEHAVVQAENYGHSLQREIGFLTVHSMLHLLGYDHEAGGIEQVRMREKEEAILTQLGLKRNSSYYLGEE